MTRIYHFRIELCGGTTNKNENWLVIPTKDKAAKEDAPCGQLNTVCLANSISRLVLLIGGWFVGGFLRLVPRNKLLTPVASYSVRVFVFFFHLFWTSGLWTYQPGSRRRKVTQDLLSTFLLWCYTVYFLKNKSSIPQYMQFPGRGPSRKRVAPKPSTRTFGA